MILILACALIYLIRVIVAPTPKKSDVLMLVIAAAGIVLWLLVILGILHLPAYLTGVP